MNSTKRNATGFDTGGAPANSLWTAGFTGVNCPIAKPRRQQRISRELQRACHLIINPRCAGDVSSGRLDALRLQAIWDVVRRDPASASRFVETARWSPAEKPFAFSELQAEEMRLDALIMRGAA